MAEQALSRTANPNYAPTLASHLFANDDKRMAVERKNKTFLNMLSAAAVSHSSRNLLSSSRTRAVVKRKHQSISRDPKNAIVLDRGCVYSYCTLPNGKRQILKVLAPGELCNPWVIFSDNLEADILACSLSRLILFPLEVLRSEPEHFSAILEMAVGREHLSMIEKIVSLGRHTARERVVLFLLDLAHRLQRAGLALDDSFDIGVTQGEMADALGISAVHANRAIADLKKEGLISTKGKRYQLLNRNKLVSMVSFDTRPTLLTNKATGSR